MDHRPHHMVHEIGVQTRAPHQQALEQGSPLTHESGSRGTTATAAALAEDSLQSQVVHARRIELETSALATIVLGERAPIVAERLDPIAIPHIRTLAADRRHQLVDELELAQRAPALIVAPPARARLQP